MISVQQDGRILIATLCRPPVNAMNAEMAAQLEALFDRAAAVDDIAVLHLRSDQKVFSAGGDMPFFEKNFGDPAGRDLLIEKVTLRLQRLFDRIEAAPFITLAEISGHALGGGLELAMACDLRVAAHEARLGLTEVQLGLLAGLGGTQRLTRYCGLAVAKRLILGAEMVNGAEAERLRIVQWSMPRAEVTDFARNLSLRYASMPQAAQLASKRCIAAAIDVSKDGFAEEISESRHLYAHPETHRTVAAFVASRRK
jgi:enoyl-CoA hydratase/carnithine racemase